jgi:uncharacterized protein YggE
LETNMFAQVIRLSPVALIAALALPAAAQMPVPHTPIGIGDTATIETSASREVRIAPDRATLTLAVETRAPSAAQAAQMNAKAQRAVLDTLRAIGISPGQMGTAGFTVQANYEPNPKGGMQRNGFVANNAITVRLTQLDRVGAVIDAALAKGATNVSDVTFDASNTADARRAALADAAAQAKSDAMVLAKAMGGTLGPLIYITTSEESPEPQQRILRESFAGAQAQTPILAGDIVVSASVRAKWAFVPTP